MNSSWLDEFMHKARSADSLAPTAHRTDDQEAEEEDRKNGDRFGNRYCGACTCFESACLKCEHKVAACKVSITISIAFVPA